MFTDVTRMFTDVHGCSRMFNTVTCTRMFTDVHVCYTDVHGCSWMFTDVHGCPGMLTDDTRMFTDVVRMYTDVHCSSIIPRCPEKFKMLRMMGASSG